jgi:hypothetical protein
MKRNRSFLIGIIIIGSLAMGLNLLHAQAAMVGSFNNGLVAVQSASPDSIVQLTADAQGLTQVAPADLPHTGTYWLVMPSGFPAPAPCPPLDPGVPVYQMASGQFLVDETGGQVAVNPRRFGMQAQSRSSAVTSALAAQANTVLDLITQVQTAAANEQMQAMGLDVLSPGGGGSGTNGFYSDSFNFHPDYGTNLFIAQASFASGGLSGIVSNSFADIQYEIQYTTDLTQPWQSAGWFAYGSELTNWTPFSVPGISPTNLFLRIRSWQDDGSGLPIWWQEQYFGTTGVDPYGDPKGDGWNNLQKFQNGMNPNVFYTPPAPQGLSVAYHPANNTAAISWQTSPGPVTGYTVERTYLTTYDKITDDFSIGANGNSFEDNAVPTQDAFDDAYNGPTLAVNYKVKAHYAPGDSAWSGAEWIQQSAGSGSFPSAPTMNLVQDSQGLTYLAASLLPPDTVALRLTRINRAGTWNGDDSFNANFDISVSSSSSGLYSVSNYITLAGRFDDPPAYSDEWYAQAVSADSNVTAAAFLTYGYASGEQTNLIWLMPPFYDGRSQLKQNLVFLLREANINSPFYLAFLDTNGNESAFITSPSQYAYAGYYNGNTLDVYRPFADNYIYKNFVFNTADVDADGRLTTGAGDWGNLIDWSLNNYGGLTLDSSPAYQFQPPTTIGTAIASLLEASQTRWLASYPFVSDAYHFDQIGVTTSWSFDDNPPTMNYALDNSARNFFGLPFQSVELVYDDGDGNLATQTVSAGNNVSIFTYPNVYAEVAQPQFQTAEYDFWNSSSLPGMMNFTNGQANDLLIVPVGSSINVKGYAKLSVANGYSGVYGYLGQYFDQAYQIDGNGNVTTNTTGVLSPYGNFFATEPGPAALVTMPDIDTGERGTGVVYAVGAVIDRNQGSPMDLYFAGANATSVGSPAVVWADNNFDRWHTVDGSDSEQDDLGAVDISKLPAYQQVPDCDYVNSYGQSAIPCTRDLEDYFRLWTPGVAALMKVLPSNYTVQLTLSGAGQIRIFQAIEANGGTNYLFDETTASNQVANSASLYVGLLTSSSPIVFNISTNFNEHFIFCGAQTGSAKIDLQVLDANQNVIADAPTYLQINDIKQMYERWTVGENPAVAPKTVATWQADNLAFQYPLPTDANTPYILFVHGWNMETWEKDRYAESAFKRLYWQGYKGRFGSFRWPTGNKFSGIISALLDARNYDNSESNAWASATGLLNKLNDLNAEYPGNVYLMAHSMGNVVAGEALKLAGGNQVVNTYVAMQGAVPAHCYDSSTANRATPTPPDRYAHYYTDGASIYFASSAGAGTYVNFYNTNDWALSWWNFDQSWKPDNLNYPGYNYSVSGLHPNGFYVQFGTGTNDFRNLNFPDDTYAIFAYGDPSWSFALGAQADVAGAFKKGSSYQEINLPSVWPADTHLNSTNNPYSAHVWHSAEFRSDNMSLAVFWNAMMKQMFP